ncbi:MULTISPECIES: hypothetical protein [Crateriforma]|uniref:Secreted protein n=1 Tax=Crateriforma conspicua TaxID=2527996 RepID=A0A5C6FV21_9PLAN|nr:MULTISPECIES: hypothetical protein [Crateriforma]TWU66932.1 hypothetical protein V7x_25040 [Crateriforma conspicua]
MLTRSMILAFAALIFTVPMMTGCSGGGDNTVVEQPDDIEDQMEAYEAEQAAADAAR